MKDNNSAADFVAMVAIVVSIVSGSMNLHLLSENNRLNNQYQGFKDGCVYGN
jgi:hypothetical protein